MIFGIVGMLLIILSWIPQTIRNIKKRKTNLDIRFIVLYLFGSFVLFIYSILIGDFIFTAFNAFATFLALINLNIELGEKK